MIGPDGKEIPPFQRTSVYLWEGIGILMMYSFVIISAWNKNGEANWYDMLTSDDEALNTNIPVLDMMCSAKLWTSYIAFILLTCFSVLQIMYTRGIILKTTQRWTSFRASAIDRHMLTKGHEVIDDSDMHKYIMLALCLLGFVMTFVQMFSPMVWGTYKPTKRVRQPQYRHIFSYERRGCKMVRMDGKMLPGLVLVNICIGLVSTGYVAYISALLGKEHIYTRDIENKFKLLEHFDNCKYALYNLSLVWIIAAVSTGYADSQDNDPKSDNASTALSTQIWRSANRMVEFVYFEGATVTLYLLFIRSYLPSCLQDDNSEDLIDPLVNKNNVYYPAQTHTFGAEQSQYLAFDNMEAVTINRAMDGRSNVTSIMKSQIDMAYIRENS